MFIFLAFGFSCNFKGVKMSRRITTDADETWRRGLEQVAKESLEGMDEEFGEGAAEESRTIQRLLTASNYGRKAATAACKFNKRLSPGGLLRDAARDLAAGNTYHHSEGLERHTEAAQRLLSAGEMYLGRFGSVSVEPFPDGFGSYSVNVSFRPKNGERS